MKKVTLLLTALFAFVAVSFAGEDKPISVDKMPQAAQTFIKQYFPGKSIALAKMDSEFFGRSYDVIFTNGDKVEFDKKGEWTKIDCDYSQVPMEAVPSAIRTYVKSHYPSAKIKQIEKDRKKYELELSNGWEIKFDKSFNVIKLDR